MWHKLRLTGLNICISLITVLGLASGSAAAAPSSVDNSDMPAGTQLIWCGLVNGANFNIFNTQNCNFSTTGVAANSGTSSSQPANNAGLTYTNNYIALGDSVAAGLGLPPTPNGNTLDVECGRSNQAYADQVAMSLNMPLGVTACSGATAGDLVTEQDDLNGPNAPAQLDNAFANGVPRLMTITVGANDAHWDDFIRACYAYDCGGHAYTVAARGAIALMEQKLSFALSDIQLRSGGQPPVVILTGYYNPLSSDCGGQQQNITPAEINWLSDETANLNTALHSVASNYSFVHYVPIDFSGHDICSGDPWVQGLDDRAPFHPTAAGQAAIADTVTPVAQNLLASTSGH